MHLYTSVELLSREGALEGVYTRELYPTYVSNARAVYSSFAGLFVKVMQAFNWDTVFIVLDSGSVPVYVVGARSMEQALRKIGMRFVSRIVSTNLGTPFDFTGTLSYFQERSRSKFASQRQLCLSCSVSSQFCYTLGGRSSFECLW